MLWNFEKLALEALAQQEAMGNPDLSADRLIHAFTETTVHWMRRFGGSPDYTEIRAQLAARIERACRRWANPTFI